MKQLFIFLISLSLIFSVKATETSYCGYSKFKYGELKGTSLDIDGNIKLAKKILKETELSETFIWSSVSINGILYLSAGEKGKIYKYDLNTKESPKLLTYFEEGTVYALGLFKGKLYAGLSPSGKVFTIDLTTGKKTELIDTKSNYIWQILSTDKYVYFACGMPGKVVRLDKNNIRKDFCENLDDHIESLTVYENQLYCGTSPSGYILKSISPEKSYLLYDSNFNEVKSLSWFNNKLYAICFNGTPHSNPQTKIKPAREVKTAPLLKGGIVTIDKNNLPDVLYNFSSFAPMSMEVTKEGIFIGTGHSGKLIYIDKEDNLLIEGEVDNGQITDFIKVNSKLYFTTSNSAMVYSLSNRFELKGEFIAKPINAKIPVNWGNFYFSQHTPTGTRIEYYVRGGNSASPDITWSDWQLIKSGTKPNLQITSKIQWKAKLISHENSISPVFYKAKVFYRSVNYKPNIKKLYVLPNGFYIDKKATTPKNEFIPLKTKYYLKNFSLSLNSKFGYKKGVKSFIVIAQDKNKDKLEYKFSLLNNGKTIELTDFQRNSYYSLNTYGVPQGTYKLKVEVRDKIDNNPRFFTVSKTSLPFIIDTTAPAIKNIQQADGKITFTVQDNLSTIEQVLVSNDKGKTFEQVFPKDKINDSKTETYDYTLEKANNGLLIKAFDSSGNESTKFKK
jgi:hypothetical protein